MDRIRECPNVSLCCRLWNGRLLKAVASGTNWTADDVPFKMSIVRTHISCLKKPSMYSTTIDRSILEIYKAEDGQ